MSVVLKNSGNVVLLQKVKSSTVSLLIFNMPLRAVSQVQVSWMFSLNLKVLLGFVLSKIFQWH